MFTPSPDNYWRFLKAGKNVPGDNLFERVLQSFQLFKVAKKITFT